MNDITILALMKTRDNFERFYDGINQDSLTQCARDLLRCIKAYYKATDSSTLDDFEFFLSQSYSSLIDGASSELYKTLLKKLMETEVSEEQMKSITKFLLNRDFMTKASRLILKASEEPDFDLLGSLKVLSNDPKYNISDDGCALTADCLDDWISDNLNSNGLSWGLKCLDDYFRPIKGGLLCLVAARVNAGKTSFCCTLGASWASVLKNTGGMILHFNNEGKSNNIMARYVQVVTGYSVEEIIELGKDKVLQDFYKKVGKDTIRIVSAHGYALADVEKAIELYRPKIVVIDMLEHIRIGNAEATGERTDQRLETLAQQLRMMAVEYDCAIVTTVQLSKDAENVPYPELSMLKDSKTGLQAAADAIITIGQSSDPAFLNTRFIGCVKSKITKTGAFELRNQVCIDKVTGKYTDPTDVNV